MIRWNHPERGVVSPVDFIPLAEKSTAISALCEIVLRDACRTVTSMREIQPNFYISVNVSPIQLQIANFDQVLMDVLESEQVDASSIKIEFTESHFIENLANTEKNIKNLRTRGFGIYLDDFGTGYSNLGYLQRLKFETLKIDRSFITNIGDRTDHRSIVHAIQNLSSELGMDVIAEGVETESDYQVVKSLGIRKAQGYFWSKPITDSELSKLV